MGIARDSVNINQWGMIVIIGIVNEKGGAGKTTTAVNYFECLVSMGKEVILIDMDVKGRAASLISDINDGALNKNVYRTSEGDYKELVRLITDVMTDSTDVVIIDTPPGITEETCAVVDLANVFVVPGLTSYQDKELTIKTTEMLKRRSDGSVFIQPNRIFLGQHMSTLALSEYKELLGDMYCLPPIRHSTHIEKAIQLGLSLFTTDTAIAEDYKQAIIRLLSIQDGK